MTGKGQQQSSVILTFELLFTAKSGPSLQRKTPHTAGFLSKKRLTSY